MKFQLGNVVCEIKVLHHRNLIKKNISSLSILLKVYIEVWTKQSCILMKKKDFRVNQCLGTEKIHRHINCLATEHMASSFSDIVYLAAKPIRISDINLESTNRTE